LVMCVAMVRTDAVGVVLGGGLHGVGWQQLRLRHV
jgi:hypothetical protein